jgi:hypothetical protein
MDLYANHVLYDFEYHEFQLQSDRLIYNHYLSLFMRQEHIRLEKEKQEILRIHAIKRQLMAMGPLKVVMADPELRKIAMPLYEQIKDYVNGL